MPCRVFGTAAPRLIATPSRVTRRLNRAPLVVSPTGGAAASRRFAAATQPPDGHVAADLSPPATYDAAMHKEGGVDVPALAVVAAIVAAACHVLFFVLESVLFTRPEVAARFRLTSPEAIAAVRPMAFNQGFYNLFLALGVVGGLLLVASGSTDPGRAIALFACACMTGAGVVLFATSRAFTQSAAIQALPPATAIIAAMLLR